MKQNSLKKWNEFFLAKIEDLKVTKILFCAIKVHKTMMWKKKHIMKWKYKRKTCVIVMFIVFYNILRHGMTPRQRKNIIQ